VATSFGNSSFGPRAKKTVASSRAPQAPARGEEARARQATSGENINSHDHPPGVFGLCYLVSTYMFMGSINENFQLRHQFYKSRSQHIGLQAKVSGKPRYLAWGARLQITGSIY